MWQRLPTMCRAGSWTGERAVWWWHEVEVLATSATFQGELFSSVVSRHASGIEVLAAACPQWVDLVETGTVTGPDAEREVVKVLDPLIEDGADTFVLACTHFSFLKPTIEKVSGLEVIDPAPAVAAQTARVAPDPDGTAGLTLAASGDAGEFSRLAAALASRREPVIPFAP
jgi:glutamate racemase